ncbi:MAG TPA: Gfo/Idh/MocA family oxidoreductase [Candidatus Limnocylindria bacterium]|nr:Gfo/Idh/MocA family oxidoreductase [Candidatus Limnocylindria bacterium]
MGSTVGVGMLGSGFIGEFHALGLRSVPAARVVANQGRSAERREAFGRRFDSRAYDSIESLCADPAVDLVIVSLPNELHLQAVQAAAGHGKAVACTKPLGRNGAEAAEMLRQVDAAGAWHGYLENVVFTPDLLRMRGMIEAGAIGRPLTMRAREGHSGPHAAHFWDVAAAGGGALLDMGSHGVEAARFLFGKENRIADVFAWGATLAHGARTQGEDNAVTLLRFEDGRLATIDNSWTSKGGLEGRFEVTGEAGRLISDISVGTLRGFIERSAGYLAEKADADTGWVFPAPDETYAHGHEQMMAHMLDSLRAGRLPTENFHDGLAVNSVLDAAYRSMSSGSWEAVSLPQPVAA